jgi:SPP1 family predicted phage head-tail adaptor
MEAGKRDRRISIERASTYQDDTGQEVPRWLPVATVWASWRRASARETLAASEVSAEATDIFEILRSNLTAEVSPRDRVIFDGRTYDISAADPIGRQGIRIQAAARSD